MNKSSTSSSPTNQISRLVRLENAVYWGFCIILVVSILLSLVWKLTDYPTLWFDEGEFLQVPKNLLTTGQYATRSSEGMRVFDPAITTGPSVLLPIAVALQIFGVGLLPARMVMVGYAIGSIVMMILIARSFANWRAVAVIVGVMVFAPWSQFLNLGRQVMGEMAAFAWLLLGIWLFRRTLLRPSWSLSVLTGIAFGLSILAKPQSALIWPTLIAVMLADRFYYKEVGTRRLLVPLITSMALFAAWYLVQWSVLGNSEFLARVFDTGSATGTTLATFSPRRWLANVNTLWQSSYIVWGAPAIIYQAAITIQQRRRGAGDLLLLLVVVVWLAWYVLGSVGWIRYAFTPITISTIFIVRLIGALTNEFYTDWSRLRSELRGEVQLFAAGQMAFTLVPIAIVLLGIVSTLDSIRSAPTDSAQEMAALLDQEIPRDAVIETWEWQLAFLSDRTFHHPPFEVLEAKIRELQFGQPYPPELYQVSDHQPAYLIEGPFSNWTQLYASESVKNACKLIEQADPYEMYKCSW